MKIQALFVVSLAIVFVSGCGSAVPWITPPATGYTVNNSRLFAKSYNQVWGNILKFAGESGMQLKDVDKENGLIVAELVAFEDDIADCGKDATMQVIERRASLNILVHRSNGEVVVTVNNEFKESRKMMTASDTVTCNSKGELERRILNAAGA